MKRYLYCILAFVLFAGFACKKDEREVAREGAVNFVIGDVFLIDGGNKAKAKIGDAVKKGMKIETGKKAMADIYFGENAIKVLENSSIRVDQLVTVVSTNSEQTEFYVEKGRLFSKVARKLAKGDNYSVKTPTTIAAVRGTNFLVTEEEKKGQVACLDGLVDVLNKSMEGEGNQVQLKDGQEVTVEQGKAMNVKDLSEANKKMIQDILSSIRDMQADIRKKFEDERDRILKVVEDQKQMNKEMMEKQIEQDKQNVKDQIDKDKDNINKVLGDTDVKGVAGSADGQKSQSQDAVKAQQDQQKDLLKGVLPDIKQQQ